MLILEIAAGVVLGLVTFRYLKIVLSLALIVGILALAGGIIAVLIWLIIKNVELSEAFGLFILFIGFFAWATHWDEKITTNQRKKLIATDSPNGLKDEGTITSPLAVIISVFMVAIVTGFLIMLGNGAWSALPVIYIVWAFFLRVEITHACRRIRNRLKPKIIGNEGASG